MVLLSLAISALSSLSAAGEGSWDDGVLRAGPQGCTGMGLGCTSSSLLWPWSPSLLGGQRPWNAFSLQLSWHSWLLQEGDISLPSPRRPQDAAPSSCHKQARIQPMALGLREIGCHSLVQGWGWSSALPLPPTIGCSWMSLEPRFSFTERGIK